MEGHHDGEIWGLAVQGDFIYTTADDNQVKKWCPNSRKCVGNGIVNEAVRAQLANRTSTFSKFPDSQSARAVAISSQGLIAVCANDGSVTIR